MRFFHHCVSFFVCPSLSLLPVDVEGAVFFFSVDYCNYCAHFFKFVFLNVELFVYILLIELPMHENDPETVDFFFKSGI